MGCVNSKIAVSMPKFDLFKLQNAQNRFKIRRNSLQNPPKILSKCRTVCPIARMNNFGLFHARTRVNTCANTSSTVSTLGVLTPLLLCQHLTQLSRSGDRVNVKPKTLS